MISEVDNKIKVLKKQVDDLIGVKESDTGLCHPSQWDLANDEMTIKQEQSLLIARCNKILSTTPKPTYMISIRQVAKYVVGLDEQLAPTDIEESMRIGVDKSRFSIKVTLQIKIK